MQGGASVMTLTFRPATIVDVDVIASVCAQSETSWKPSAAELAKEIESTPKHVRAYRLLGYAGSRPVAYGAISNDRYVQEAWRWVAGVRVIESDVRQGHGRSMLRALYEWFGPVLAGLPLQPTPLLFSSTDDSPSGEQFARSFGFEPVEVRYISGMETVGRDLGRFDGLEPKLAAEGVTLTTLADIPAGPARIAMEHALHELDALVMPDEPSTSVGEPLDFDAWRAEYIAEQDPAGAFIAMHGNTPIGMCIHWFEDGEILIAVTGVTREWRSRGVATAMKVRGIRYAQGHGMALRAFNSAANTSVLKINESLGFIRRSTVTRWQTDPHELGRRLKAG
jgi:mycothiol synthase